MNQGTIAAAIALFVVPVGLAVCWNFDELVLGVDPEARPQGTLIYLYSDS